jgi:chain length determinant protein (polysaccharide antigen chain regulator)
LEDFFAEFSKTINLETNKIQKNVEKVNYEKPVNVSIEGNDATVIASFLNDLTAAADAQTVNEFLSIMKQKIDIRLNEITRQKALLSERYDRKIKNEIRGLSDALDMAIELGIKNNNFSGINNNNNNNNNASLKIDLSNTQSLPKWYLLGSKALSKEIELLKKNKFNFIPEIAKLEVEEIKLKSFILSSVGINAMQINQRAYPPEASIKPKKRLIVAVAFIAGFILSIFLVFIMNAFRKEEDTATA